MKSIVDLIINLFSPTATAVALYLVHQVITLFENRIKIHVSQQQEEMIDKWVTDGIHYAEEKARKTTIPSPAKLDAAVEYVTQAMERVGVDVMTGDKVAALVEAKLNQKRSN